MNPKSYRSPRWILALALCSMLYPLTMALAAEREELIDERTVGMKTFLNSDGSRTLHLGLEPLHYRPEGSETFENIDPSLILEGGWLNETNSFAVRLPEQLGTGEFVELAQGAIRWRPGMLFGRTLSGAEIPLGEAAPSWGAIFDEVDNTVIYQDLYPGMDLLAEVRRGVLNLTFRFNGWAFWLAPEQIESFRLEADFEITDHSLLEAVEERLNEGEGLPEVPLYFGRRDDEYVIGLFGFTGVSDDQLETYGDAVVKAPEGEPAPAPDSWRSNFWYWMNTGRLEHYFRYPLAPTFGDAWGTGSIESALTASFRFVERSTQEERRFFSATYSTAFHGKDPIEPGVPAIGFTSRCFSKPNAIGPCRWVWNYLAAGKGDGEVYRSLLVFQGVKGMHKALLAGGPAMTITDVKLGRGMSLFNPPGVSHIRSEEVIAYRGLPWMYKDGMFVKIVNYPDEMPEPYDQLQRTVTGGSIKTSTRAWNSGQSVLRTINGNSFLFGSLMHVGGTSRRVAATDLRKFLLVHKKPVGLLLAMPFDRNGCSFCTAGHSDSAAQALSGSGRVGAGFFDFRLEVTTSTATSEREAEVTATSVGGHNDRLYPGATLSWDLEMTAFTGTPDVLELVEPVWDSKYFDAWTTNPATGALLTDPTLSSVGDKVRFHVKWKRADPGLYGKTRDLTISGGFQSGAGSAGQVDIPVALKAPEGNPSFSQIYPVVDNDISQPMGLAWIQLPASGIQAAVGATGELRKVSGPTKQLTRGTHWDLWNLATPGNDGELVIYPDQFQVGMYTVELTPCLIPEGMAAPGHCLAAAAQQITFEVRQACCTTPPPTPQPVIDFVAPWSLDNPSGGPVTVSIFGQNVGGASAGTLVTIPQVVTNATPLAGSTASRTNLSANLSTAGVCGPRQLQLTTAGGTDQHLFNVTQPFQGSPNHFATEAEAGVLSGLKILSFPEASAGKAVGPDLADVKSNVTFKMQVPATSADYQLYVLYRTPGSSTARANATIKPVGASGTTIAVALPATSGKDFKLASLYDLRLPKPPSKFALQAGQTYDVILSTRTGQDFPLVDMLVLSDGSLPPRLSELCR